MGWVYNVVPANAYVNILSFGGTNPLVLQRDGGNVGIGTIVPSSKLNVEASGSASEVFRISNDNDATKDSIMIMNSAGNVGIGTTTPNSKLHVNGRVFIDNSGNALSFSGNPALAVGGALGQNIAQFSNSGGTIQMTLTSAGNTGIGTISPGAKLEVAPASFTAAAQSRTALRLNAGSFGNFTNNALNMEFGNAGTAVIGAEVPSSGGMYDLVFSNFSTSTNFTEKVRITGSGNVGIGCTLPQYKLHVIGDIASSGTVRTTNVLATGPITACSDIRFKKQITPLQNSLKNILKLQGVNYFWKTKEFPDRYFNEINQIGLIAQEVEKIFPELVVTNIDGYKSVDYSKLTPILVEAIKELKAENEKLAAKNASLNVSIDILEAQTKEKFTAIEAKINSLMNVPVTSSNK